MQANLKKIIAMQNFFSMKQLDDNRAFYNIKHPSCILAQNIYVQWLTSIWSKADKHFPILLTAKAESLIVKDKIPIGQVGHLNINYDENKTIEHTLNEFQPKSILTPLQFKLYVPQQDKMQTFVHWQRYRKYWWSSVTTSSGLFSVNDPKYADNIADVDIVGHFPWGKECVEKVSIENVSGASTASLNCSTTLESALFVLLTDGTLNGTEEGYLRLHRQIAPYKISFAIQYKDDKSKAVLPDLAMLLSSKLTAKNISTWIPDFQLPFENQINESLQLGVVYTAVLSDDTLADGIFHLLNSSTMLKEQVHIADFESYAAALCGK